MASKYGGLPDIDTAPDVYETEDVPEWTSSSGGRASLSARSQDPDAGSSKAASAAPPQSEDIDSKGLSIADATQRFQKSAKVDAAGADFSGALKARPRRAVQLYPATASFETDTYELAGYSSANGRAGSSAQEDAGQAGSSSESRVDRLRRLRWEIEQLEREVGSAPAPSADAEGSAGGAAGAAGGQDAAGTSASASKRGKDPVPPAAILEQLAGLSTSLARVEAAAASSAQQRNGRGEWAEATRELIRSLGELEARGGGGTAVRSDSAEAGQAAAHSASTSTGGAAAAGSSVPLPQLEGKILELEKVVGVRDILMDETRGLQRPLLESVARLEHQLTLLTQPRQLDAVSRRVKVLSTELERLHEARRKAPAGSSASAGGAGADGKTSPELSRGASATGAGPGDAAGAPLDAETAARVSSMFALQRRLEPLLPLGHSLLARMRTLGALHASASAFSARLDGAVGAGAQLRAGQDEARALLQQANESLAGNAAAVAKNLEATEQRIEALSERIDKLLAAR